MEDEEKDHLHGILLSMKERIFKVNLFCVFHMYEKLIMIFGERTVGEAAADHGEPALQGPWRAVCRHDGLRLLLRPASAA